MRREKGAVMTARDPDGRPNEAPETGFYIDDEYIDPVIIRTVFPPNPWDERARAHIEEHLAKEEGATQAYEAFAETPDPAVAYLARLIAADERRHHRVLERIAAALGTERAATTAALTRAERDRLRGETQRLIDIESDDAHALRSLAHDVRGAPAESLWPALVEMMRLDTEKHIRLLRAIDHHLRTVEVTA